MAEHNLLRKYFGFFFTVSLLACVTTYNMYNLTSYESIESFSNPVLQEIGFASFVNSYYPPIIELARQNPEVSLQFPGLPLDLDIKGRDIANLSEEEASRYFIARLIRAVYREPGGLDLPPEAEERFGPLILVTRVFNYRTHELLRVITLVLIAVTMVFLFSFVYLSPRFKKFTGPGIALVAVGLPLCASIYLSRIVMNKMLAQEGISLVVLEAVKSVISRVQIGYLVLLLLGFTLIIIGKAGEVMFRNRGIDQGERLK